MKTDDYFDQREEINAEFIIRLLRGNDPLYTVELLWNPPGKIYLASTPTTLECKFNDFWEKVNKEENDRMSIPR